VPTNHLDLLSKWEERAETGALRPSMRPSLGPG
jgi:hypothetical protein